VSGIGCCPYIQSAPIPSSGRFILGVLVWVSCYTINRLSRKRRKGQWGTVYVLYHLKKGVLNPNPCGLTGEWRVSEERTENRVADEVDASLTAHTQTHIHARSFLHHVFGYLRRSFYMYNRDNMYTPQQHAYIHAKQQQNNHGKCVRKKYKMGQNRREEVNIRLQRGV